MPAEELEKMTRKALVEELEQVALEKQADQGEEALATAVVAATAAEVEEALQETLLETLQKTPTKARNVAVMMTMVTMTPRMIQIRSSRRILQ